METKDSTKTLLDTYQMGDLTLSNRIAMAAMTRIRTDPKTGIPNDLMVKYLQPESQGWLYID
jgi:NADH:flavin oxidoreductases, Old Yellow Enzyme family